MDVVKIRIQVRGSNETQQYVGQNLWKVLFEIVRKQGILALWKGTSPSVVRSLVMGTIQLAVYDDMKNKLRRRGWSDDFKLFGLSGFIAGFACVIVGSPLDVLRSRRMVHGARFSIPQLFIDVYKEKGFLGYYRGFVMLLLRMCGFNVVLFYTLETLKKAML